MSLKAPTIHAVAWKQILHGEKNLYVLDGVHSPILQQASYSFMESIKLSLLLLFFCTVTFFAVAKDFSIVGYSPEDLASEETLMYLFENWMAKHSKSYASFQEKLRKFGIFKDNLKHIDETNTERKSYWLGLNEFADMSHEEFKHRYLGLNTDLPKIKDVRFKARETFMYEKAANLPRSVDWRKKGAVTPVKNQGGCGKKNIF